MQEEVSSQEIQIKIMVLGSTQCGRKSLMTRFAEGMFEQKKQPTIGLELVTERCTIGEQKVKAILFDFRGGERMMILKNSHVGRCHATIICIDLNSSQSFSAAKRELEAVLKLKQQHQMKFQIYLIGCKSDLQRKLYPHEISEYAQSCGEIKYFETSAKLNVGIDQVFETILQETLPFALQSKANGIGLNSPNTSNKSFCW